MPTPTELPANLLRHHCDPRAFSFETTDDLDPLDEVIGQERAVRAIDFGLNMKSPGYHIFVTGNEGTGKTTIVQDIVMRHAKKCSTPEDWCMVNHFADPFHPRPLRLPAGEAAVFAKTMGRFVEDAGKKLAAALESDEHRRRYAEVQEKFALRKRQLLETLDASAAEKGLMLNKTATGFQTLPLSEGKPLSAEAFRAMGKPAREAVEDSIRKLQLEIETTVREVQKLNADFQQEVDALRESVARYVVENRLGILRERYQDCKEVLEYFDALQSDIVDNVAGFTFASETEETADPDLPSMESRYAVNVLVNRKPETGAPVVFEPNPTSRNLFGRIEKKTSMGNLVTDFTMVQAGSLLEANGGFLICEVESLLQDGYVWEALKRALQIRQLTIEDSPKNGGAAATLRPQPVDLEVKVILIGSARPFFALQNLDTKFNKLFKVRADFDDEVVRDETTVLQYARFIARIGREQHLLPFAASGVAGVVEYGQARIGWDNKLSLRFGPIVGMIMEAEYWARQEQAVAVTDRHVDRAIAEHRFRYNLNEEKLQEAYVNETIMIDVAGDAVGQVNALAVYHLGDISFGRPSRITAETYMGKHGIINVEREAKLSGKTHDKGVLILSGFLGRTFARTFPLSLSISVAFEQSYGGIDGDSASSTELYAILSSLSGFPIHQGLAATGSVNQKGEIQAIGGVNQKIEGFFDVCQAKGLTGRQGVLIPEANIKNLMLKKEVVGAVAQGRFHVYSVRTIAQGIETLTGIPAGIPDRRGRYPAKTVFGAVQRQLLRFLKRSLLLKKGLEGHSTESL